MTAPPLLELQGLVVRYGAVTAVRGLDLQVRSGELVALLGANGAGKSTTLRAISSLVPVVGGRVLWQGVERTGCRTETTVRLGIGHCPEGRRVLARQSVATNLELGAWLRRDRAGIAADLERCYGLFPRLAERRRQLAGNLSGGEQQMLAIARALMGRPSLLLLDEPSLGLAPKLVAEVMAALAALHQEGLSMLLVEQNATAALEIADRGVVLESGSISLEGTADALLADAGLRASYLGSG
ncbi:ABC transporter ATP-binding protein [Cyanobium sp. Cruz CV13-4-11]|jgi:branched-chain amino acid transport system ATP-binding protein|uniref:ABC transporter ATP-binding protein n=1 Tax=unclassified Cyanobium TaxID=2627006 RepID=UPI0020CB6B4B|nr:MULTISPECIES: ABC transporter ATP-binding protein [unclassified Cyanobium]MCP9901539.1 ABC transporter ATP-binding protein [Cyanobium sp. Cruz CV11-17]MCP9918654.1 ABC transporter ATP-binding protein [Cyanobium sp. Cruz CV13-4-11]